MKFMHRVKDRKRKTKFYLRLYHLLRSRVMPLFTLAESGSIHLFHLIFYVYLSITVCSVFFKKIIYSHCWTTDFLYFIWISNRKYGLRMSELKLLLCNVVLKKISCICAEFVYHQDVWKSLYILFLSKSSYWPRPLNYTECQDICCESIFITLHTYCINRISTQSCNNLIWCEYCNLISWSAWSNIGYTW